jgi:DHA2 family methylenomycin A resistance protein-like MFS transporter
MSVAIPTFDTPHVRTRLAITVACTSLGFFVVQLDGSILNIALSQIGISLRTGIGDLQWTVDAYFLTFAVLLLSAGSLSDRWGARRAFVSGFVVFSAASLSCGVAPNATALIAARAMQGAGAALLVPWSLTLLDDACGSDVGARARAVGLWTAAGGVGMAAGPVLGGLLVGAFGWRSIFFVNLPLGLAGIWLTLRFLDQHEPPQRRRSLDLAGQALAALTLLGFVGAIIEAGSLGWHTRLVLSGAILAVIAGVAFIVVEAKAADPALPRELFQSTISRTAVLIGFSVNLVIFGISFAFALYFQRVLSFTTVETGLAFLPFALMITAANVVGGRFVARCGLRIPIVMGLVIAAAGCVLLFGISGHTPYLAILPGQLIIRIGIGLVVPAMTTGVLSAVQAARSGVASGALNAVRQTGGAVGVALFGALMATDMVQGLRIALTISGLLLLVTAIISFAGVRVPQGRNIGLARSISEGRSRSSSARPRSKVQSVP